MVWRVQLGAGLLLRKVHVMQQLLACHLAVQPSRQPQQQCLSA
jgi:hypothetical protein